MEDGRLAEGHDEVNMKHYISSNAKCPFYKHEDGQMVYCVGLQEGTTIHLAFANRVDASCYKKTFCQKYYKTCRICQMLERRR